MVRLLPALSQPVCRLIEPTEGAVFHSLGPGESTSLQMRLTCPHVGRLGVGVVALSPTVGPLDEEFVLVTVTGREFALFTPAVLGAFALLCGVLGLVSLRWPLSRRVSAALILVAVTFAAASATVFDSIPLQRLEVIRLVRLSGFFGAMLIAFAVGAHTTARRLHLAAVVTLGIALSPLPESVRAVVVAGAAMLTIAGFLAPRTGQRFLAIVVLGWALLGTLAARPVLYEVLAWSLYGRRLVVIPFQ
jgi:hypothetical protein